MDIIQILFILITLFAVNAVIAEETDERQCQCGVFQAPKPIQTKDAALVMKSPSFPMKCSEDGREMCSRMCVALAEASKEKAPSVLCEILEQTSGPFTPLIYSRACGDENWTNTGLETSHVQVCCADKAVVPCPTS